MGNSSVKAIYDDDINLLSTDLGTLDHGLLRINNIKRSWLIEKQGNKLHLNCQVRLKRSEKDLLKFLIEFKLKEKGAENIVIWFD